MNREIKFRAWHPDTRVMYVDTALTSLGLNDAIEKSIQAGYNLMQFTGLKDKNGKEIYEGDIVEYENNGCLYDGRVEYISAHFEPGFFIIYNDGNFDSYFNNVEVIGNIYENHELLNK